jgi:hypothetical protein
MAESKSIWQNIYVYLLVLFLSIINVNNIKIAGFNYFFPLLEVIAIFYFAVFCNIFGFIFIFIVGIWQDSINNINLGVSSFCYIIIVKIFLTINNRVLFKENFMQIWQQFVFFCFLFLLLKWLIISLLNASFLSIKPILIQTLISIFAYVFMHKFFDFFLEKIQQ